MKTRLSVIRLTSIIFILLSSCHKEDDFTVDKIFPENAKLKRVLLFANIDSEKPISIVKEYEYDDENRISKTSSPMYIDGEIVGTMSYNLYEYDSIGQLTIIRNYRANKNSPTGFINLKNYIYTYSVDGKMGCEYIGDSQVNYSEYSLFKYDNDRLTRIEKYGYTNELESYVVNEYDNSGQLFKELSYAYDNHCISYTVHAYSEGHNIKSDVYTGKYMEHLREILRTYDVNHNLIILESNELLSYSSAMSCVLKYEYYDE
jgi:hypothetical protein